MQLGRIVSVFSALAGVGALLAACSSGAEIAENGASAAIRTAADDAPPGRVATTIVLPESSTFSKRDCTLTLRWTGGGNDVRIAGEFTEPAWGDGALPFVRASDGSRSVTIAPQAAIGLEPGKVYAYKIVVDGQWKLDPAGKYRKIVGGQMNSGLVLPRCDDGPELASGPVEQTRGGQDMRVRVTVRAAADGAAPASLAVSLDNGPLADGAYAVDRSGAVTIRAHGLAKGKHTLSVRGVDVSGRAAEPIDLPFWVEDEAFDYRDGILYMAMLDRFANGDRGNDRPLGAPVEYDADWHGGDLQGVLSVLRSGYFEKLGVRTLWLSPLNTQTDKHQVGDGNQIFSAYHGYWPIKSREVDPRFGGDAALRAVVAEAHRRGIRVLLDLINNQVHEDHEYVSANPSWFRHSCKCGDDGCGWSERPFDCMFQPYLPDIDWNQSGTEKQFIADAVNWISAFDLDGFRVDAVKHVEANSVYNMRAELSRRFEQGGARIFMVGETAVGEFDSGNFFGESFANGYEWIDAYTGPNALDGQFDFPTRHNMADGLVDGTRPLDQVEAQLAKAEQRYRPGNHHVRFLNGHDNPRIASIAAQDPKLGCSWTSGCRGDQLPPAVYTDPSVYVKLKRALTALYTMPGVPYLYMGDEVAFPGGGDPDMRRNMLFGEALADVEIARPGSHPLAMTDLQSDLREWVRRLGATRTASRALRRGDRTTLLGTDADVLVYAYRDAGATSGDVAVVALNRGAAVTSRTIDASSLASSLSATTFRSATGTGSLSASGSGSTLSLTLGAGEAAIFVPAR